MLLFPSISQGPHLFHRDVLPGPPDLEAAGLSLAQLCPQLAGDGVLFPFCNN